jgi:hypothetical protein
MPQGVGSLLLIEQSIVAIGSGSLVSIEQSIVKRGSGALVTIEQTIDLRLSGSGSLVSIEQSISSSGSGSLVTIAQKINDSTTYSNLDKFGWDAELYIDGVRVDPSLIHGLIDITRAENTAALMSVTLINKTGVIDTASFHGKTIFLNIETENGNKRAYTGTVDVPEFDLINKRITLRCTDKRNEQINGQLSSQLPFIGYWSSAIFNTPDDVAEELSQRLQTTTKTVDFDAYGNFTISDYLPKASPDFVLDDAAIYRRNPTLSVASRGRLINRVSVEFDFRYVRLRHRERSFLLEGPSFCEVMTTPGLSFLSTTGIKTNLESFGWDVNFSSVDYEYLPPAGWYKCSGFGSSFLWSPVVNTGETVNKLDEDGNVITDSDGNPVTETRITSSTDYSKAFAISASWVAAKRFAQDINQKINIQINAPQSQDQYGVIEKKQRNGLQIDFDTSDFENRDGYISPSSMTQTSTDYYLDKTGTATDFNAAINTVVAMSKTTIAKTHRDNHVTIETPIWPEIDLKHTVETTAGLIQSKGKVSNVQHRLNISTRSASTTVRLSLSQATGAQVDGSVSIPMAVAPLVGDQYSGTLRMQTYGEHSVGLNSASSATNYLGKGMITPAIDDESRNKQETVTNYSFDVSVRNDTLQVTF